MGPAGVRRQVPGTRRRAVIVTAGVSALVTALIALSLVAASAPVEAGRSEFFGIAQGALDSRDVQQMAEAGVRTERFMLKWRSVEATRGSYDWSARDWLVGALASRGIRPVPFVWGSPTWVNAFSARPPVDSATNVQAWREFLQAAVERYGPGGSYWTNGYLQRFGADAKPLPIQSWQIWNEPNLSKYFDPGQTVDHAAQRYARLLQVSHDAIKSRDPRAQIVLAGMPGYGDATAWKFLDNLYQVPGIKRDFDAAAIHPYAHDLDQLAQQVGQFRAVMTDNGDDGTPLWLTELAWGSGPRDKFGFNVGPTRQKELLSGALDLILRHRSLWNVERVFWFMWHDPDPDSGYGRLCSICGTAGLVRYDRSPKPAYDAFRAFAGETTPPVARIVSGPGEGGITDDPTPSFTFASSEPGSSFECSLEHGDFPCDSPLTPSSALADGPHSFSVRAIDAAGNESSPMSQSFIVEARPPSVTISSGPAGGSTSTNPSPSFSFASSEPDSSFSCRLDAGGFHNCTSPFTAFNLPDGSHDFQVRATDRAGKHSAIASRAWTVKGAIDLSITDGPGPGSATNDRTPSFSFSSTASGASFSCRMEGDPYVACSSPFTANTLPEGGHTFSVRATDADHNIAVDARDFTIDTTPPTVTVSSGPTNGTPTNDTTPTFRFSATEAGSSFQCSADNGGFSACSGASSDTSASPLADGPHVFRVRPIDPAGNTGRALHTGFTVDTVAPKVKIEGPHGVKIESPKASAIFTLKASEHVDRRCRSGSTSFNSCSERFRTPELSRSPHILKVKAVDRAGNVATKRKWFTLAEKQGPRGTRRASSHRSCHGAPATLVGTYRGDRLTGTEGRDVIVAFGGNDTVNARGGDDVICARHGADEVNGGRGADWIRGGRGSDDLRGGPGGDTTRGGFGVDVCGGAPGDRSFFCELLSLR